ncbi:ABC transporter permease [Conexibacter sp. JD483]|uniref:ABC transporter permease n=1 Tax=unclassified Conexibacter TaxID=2627773 RepID=UPI002718AC5D|nr:MULTISPECIES: ABC transporter permease [unclassified Conexibacter]MDO8188916.1 ABC transporter permease [Conexibacter sp. CPCC 205706]MDO8200271.1 ABC transporter permease [Conexibacter sp. CPCC 205762]MDR9373037.1 ABC transporter permease [Conexibacter sp. JD483]
MSQAAAQIAAGVAFAAAAAGLAWRYRLGLARPLATAALRAAVQLAVVGALVALVFRVPALGVAFVAVMVVTATLTAGGRLRGLPGARRAAATAIALPALAATGILLAVGAFDFSARAAIPTAGILIGGAMAATTLTGRRLLEALDSGGDELETRLALGDAARTALAPFTRQAIATGLIPAIDQTRSVGLVTLPGTFVGLLLGGASPAEAARVQLTVLLALLLVELVAAVIVAELIARACIRPGERIVVPAGR